MKSMKFEQVDGTLVGGRAASHIMEPVQLKFGDHQETIRFMVTLKMAEERILGLTWLAKWGPWIYWEKASKRVIMRKEKLNQKRGTRRPVEFSQTMVEREKEQ